MGGVKGMEGQEQVAATAVGSRGPRPGGPGQGHTCRELRAVPGPCPLYGCMTVSCPRYLLAPSHLLALHSPAGRGGITGTREGGMSVPRLTVGRELGQIH